MSNLAVIDAIDSIPARISASRTPALFAASDACERRFWEFFAATIRNKNTRLAYLTACYRFGDWCQFSP